MINMTFGRELLSTHHTLAAELMDSGPDGLRSLICACINSGWDTEEQVLAKVRQVAGLGWDHEVSALLANHSSPNANLHLWDRLGAGRYRCVDSVRDRGILENWPRPVFTRDLWMGERE